MAPTLYSRIYCRLTDLIPSFAAISKGGAMYAAPRQKDDMALYCVITPIGATKAKIEIAHDQVMNGDGHSSPWLVFEADHENAMAELVAITDEHTYYKKQDTPGYADVRRTSLNVYAVNWLACFINLHFQFAYAPNPSPAVGLAEASLTQ